MQKLISLMLLGTLLSLTVSCASTPNVPVCTELSVSKAFCTYTIEDKDFIIDDEHPYSFTGNPKDAKTWWDMRPFMVMLPYQSWARLKSYIIKMCKQNGGCAENVGTWERKINKLDEKVLNE